MKKIILALFAFSLFPLFAELYPARRVFELGLDVNVMAAQDLAPATEILRKNLVIDLKKLYNNMSDNGVTFAFSESEDFFLNLNLKKFGVGLSVGAEMDARFNLSKSLFSFLDEIRPGKVYEGEASVYAETFATFSVPIRFNIKKWKVKITPTYFVPLVYVPNVKARGSVVNNYDGTVTGSVVAPIELYTISEFKGLIKDDEFSTDFISDFDATSLRSDIWTSGGLDLSGEFEFPLFEKFDLGGYISVPILPGHLRHKVTALATASVHVDSVMQIAFDDGGSDFSYDISDARYDSCDYIVNRPLRFGLEFAWRPFGRWFTVRGRGGAALRNPFGEDVGIKSFYPEYRAGFDIVAIGMFGLSFSTEYTKQIFAHRLGVMLNFRVIEFDIAAAVCSPSFLQSFKGEGAKVGIGLRFGW